MKRLDVASSSIEPVVPLNKRSKRIFKEGKEMPMVNDRSRRLENRAVTQAKSPMQYETQIRLLEKQVDKEKARAVNATIQAKASLR